MKTVATFLNQEEAYIARSFLLANGIDAELADGETNSVIPHVNFGGASMLRLVVQDEDASDAEALLQSVNEGDTEFRGDHLEDVAPSGEENGFRRLMMALAFGALLVWFYTQVMN